MVRSEIIRPYVEQQLSEWLHVDDVRQDTNGRYPVRIGTSGFFVELLEPKATGAGATLVRVWSPAVVGVRKSAKLLSALNQFNLDSVGVRSFFINGQVIFATEAVAESLDPGEFTFACETVSQAAEHFAPELADRFGGSTMFAGEAAPGELGAGEPGADEPGADEEPEPPTRALPAGYL